MATANGSSKGPFEVPKVEVRFTKLFIDGKFVDAVSGTYTRPPP
jgi:coniferyl-aldehyde dehydrogenase